MASHDKSNLAAHLPRRVRPDLAELQIEQAVAMLRRIETAGPRVAEAAWDNLPSPYEIDIEDDDAMRALLKAVLDAAFEEST